jgi:signal transduction histidine kinase
MSVTSHRDNLAVHFAPAAAEAPGKRRLSALGNLYIWCMVLGATSVVLLSIYRLYINPIPHDWLVLAALTVLSSSFTLKVPTLPARISISEAFVFFCVLLYGPAPATVTIALDGLLVSGRRRHSWYRLLFNTAEPVMSIWVAAQVYLLLEPTPAAGSPPEVTVLLVPLAALTAVYFLLNSGFMSIAIALETGRSPISLWRHEFLWLWPNYFAGGSIAAVLLALTRQVSFSAILFILPLLIVCYLMFKSSMDRIEEASRHRAEERRLEEQLRQVQKMEAIGRLAGGIAHDFNNVLAAIIACTDVLRASTDAGDPSRSEIEEIRQAAARASRLTQQLLLFSRKQTANPTVLELRAVVATIETMLQRVLGDRIRIVIRQDPELGIIRADWGQMEQVLVNLAVNARDAMPDGGTLTIETANVDLLPSSDLIHRARRAGPHVMLSVADTGCGMDSETLSHLFEPFFTTKEAGKGTGFGLATVYGIVDQSGGFITVDSEPGRGSTFRIYLPKLDDSPPRKPETSAARNAVAAASP